MGLCQLFVKFDNNKLSTNSILFLLKKFVKFDYRITKTNKTTTF